MMYLFDIQLIEKERNSIFNFQFFVIREKTFISLTFDF